MPCVECKAEVMLCAPVLWSQGRRGVEHLAAMYARAALGCRIRGETTCAVEVKGGFLVVQASCYQGACGRTS